MAKIEKKFRPENGYGPLARYEQIMKKVTAKWNKKNEARS